MIPRPLLLLTLTLLLGASEPPTPALATLLHQVQEVPPAEAIARLQAWSGADHPLRQAALGQAYLRLADTDATQRPLAAAAFRAAVAQDPALRPAHLGLARLAALDEDWPTARRHAAAAFDPSTAAADHLVFLAETARRAGDHRLATLAAQTGVLRFPDDDRLRRLELAALVDAGRAEDARQVLLALLARHPQDTALWRHLAWAAHTTHRADESLAALEAALATAPTDAALRRSLAEQQRAAGLPGPALATLTPLIDPATSPPDLLLLAARTATDAGATAQARAWLAAVPPERRTRDLDLEDARVAAAQGDATAARSVLDRLIAAGEQDPVVLTWAGGLAEQAGDVAQAEALWQAAAASDHPAAIAATLRLAALALRQGRKDDARALVATVLARKPEDAQAQALVRHLER